MTTDDEPVAPPSEVESKATTKVIKKEESTNSNFVDTQKALVSDSIAIPEGVVPSPPKPKSLVGEADSSRVKPEAAESSTLTSKALVGEANSSEIPAPSQHTSKALLGAAKRSKGMASSSIASKSLIEKAKSNEELQKGEILKNAKMTNETTVVKIEVSSSVSSSVPTPAISPVKETELTTTIEPTTKEDKANPPETEQSARKADREKNHAKTLETEPKLVTRDGLTIIIKMKDYEEEIAKTPSPTKVVTEGTTMKDIATATSPSRRSGRARKPSARQLESEKSPLRESILGR